VPLSDHEQRLLEQIEHALYAEDPKFASAYRNIDVKRHYRSRFVRCGLLVLVGLGLLVTGVVINLIVLGVAGFVVMLLAVTWAISIWQRMAGRRAPGSPRSVRLGRGVRLRGAWRERLEERWQRRQDGRGGPE
jgi:hypothetical protein